MEMKHSPYLSFSRSQWHALKKDTPLTLTEVELQKLKGQNEPVSLKEVEEIYLPLSRLFNLYVAAKQELYHATAAFLCHKKPKVPFIIGVAGSVAVGKSTTSRILQALLSQWPNHPNVALINTDGFLFPNATLTSENLMHKKGFPESYNKKALVSFLLNLKSGKPHLKTPVYSHRAYDILPNEFQSVDGSDIVIIEGLNVLQAPQQLSKNKAQWFVSDFFDFTVYVDAPTPIIREWYLERFLTFRKKAQNDPAAFFHQFAQWPETNALEFAKKIWQEINEENLEQNILPYKHRADLILQKAKDHSVEKVFLRKL